MPGGLFAIIPAFFGFAVEIMISCLQTWSDIIIIIIIIIIMRTFV